MVPAGRFMYQQNLSMQLGSVSVPIYPSIYVSIALVLENTWFRSIVNESLPTQSQNELCVSPTSKKKEKPPL